MQTDSLFDSKIIAEINDQNYLTTLTNNKHIILGDEPESLGGQDKGFNPYEFLCSALSMCTAATLKMYADRKSLNLGKITVEVTLKNNSKDKIASFQKNITFQNKDLKPEDIKRLQLVAEACPVNKLLTNNIEIDTVLEL